MSHDQVAGKRKPKGGDKTPLPDLPLPSDWAARKPKGGDKTPLPDLPPPRGVGSVFDHKQLEGSFLAEHHKSTDHKRTAHAFRGTQKAGPVLRVSGVKGAHRIGKR